MNITYIQNEILPHVEAAQADIKASRDIAQGTSEASKGKTNEQRLADEVRLLRLGSDRLAYALELTLKELTK